jgi:hypothetical protein
MLVGDGRVMLALSPSKGSDMPPAELLTTAEHRVPPSLPPTTIQVEEDEFRMVARQLRRVHRLRIKVAA